MVNFMDTPGVGGFSYNNYQNMMGYGQSNNNPALLGVGASGVIGGTIPGTTADISATASTAADEPSFMQGLLGFRDAHGMQTPGWGGMALGAFQGLANTYLGMQQYGLAKDTLKANKEQFAKNYEAQKLTTNSALEDRQRARVASNAGAYQSVGEYMNQNGIK